MEVGRMKHTASLHPAGALTAKSDDVYGRAKIYEGAIVKGEAAIDPAYLESFNV